MIDAGWRGTLQAAATSSPKRLRQLNSWLGVFAKGEESRPQPLFDPESGNVDPEVVKYWHDHYDIAAAVARIAPSERRKLAGKLHLWVGAQDSFYLDRAVTRFAQSANSLSVDVKLAVVPGRDHFDLYTDGDDRLGLFKGIRADSTTSRVSKAVPWRAEVYRKRVARAVLSPALIC